MAIGQFIPAFPSNINRDYFSAWLAGFTDGEGCFYLSMKANNMSPWKESPYAGFQITLRADDDPVLRLIQSFFGSGYMRSQSERFKGKHAKPQRSLCLSNVISLCKVVDFFDSHPMFAKKRRDYAIWREAALLIVNNKRHRYTLEKMTTFRDLVIALKEQRKYQSPVIELPSSHEIHPLFDALAS